MFGLFACQRMNHLVLKDAPLPADLIRRLNLEGVREVALKGNLAESENSLLSWPLALPPWITSISGQLLAQPP